MSDRRDDETRKSMERYRAEPRSAERDTLRSVYIMVRGRFTVAVLLLAVALLLPGCGTSGSNSCIDEGSAAGVVISIICSDPPGKPFYSWDSSVQVPYLEVRRTANEKVLAWSVQTTVGVLSPPVRHGQLPPTPLGTFMNGNETELETGVEYRVTLFDSNQGNVVGQRTFTVLP
jgi:hypothetical protein